jgi:hypothetical protein
VLGHCTDSERELEGGDSFPDGIEDEREIDGGSDTIEIDDELEPSWTSVMTHLGISNFRPNQKEALDMIEQAVILSRKEHRLTTAAIVVPTSSGKDLLPLALSIYTRGVSIMFVPYT